MRHANTAFILAVTALATACGEPPAAEQNNAAAADIDVLPADESVATPTEDLANGAIDSPEGNSAEAGTPTAIPAALHGRWGLTVNDCQPGRSDAKGLVTIAADRINFYESVARPQTIRTSTDTRIEGTFAFVGEGMNWTSPMIWSVEDGKLVRIDSERDSRLVYSRCA